MSEDIPEYDDLQLRIDREADGSYRVLALAPEGRTGRGTFVPPIGDEDLDRFVKQVGLARRARGARDTRMEQIRDVGSELFDALLKDQVAGVYQAAWTAAQEKGRGLRINLRLSGAPELMRLPWEFLYRRPRFLSMSMLTPLVRSLDLESARLPRKVELPLRVLVVVSSPSGYPELDAAEERRKLEKALGRLRRDGLVDLQWLERATLGELGRRIAQPDDIHVLHYIGHGSYDEATESGILVLETGQGRAHDVSGEELGAMLQDEQSLRLVVLNSCEGARTSSVDPFSGIATSLIEFDIPAVIGMQFEITDEAAIAFSDSLYSGLAQGLPVDAALAPARRAIVGAQKEPEFGTPVLFLRAANARLFDIDQPPVTTSPAAQPTESQVASRQPQQASHDPGAYSRSADPSLHQHMFVLAQAHLREGNPAACLAMLDDLLRLEPRYPGAGELRERARAQERLAETYRAASDAEHRSDWLTAARLYRQLDVAQPRYRDAAARAGRCEAEGRAANLREEMRYHAEQGNWRAVVEVAGELATINPSAADPDGLASRARQELKAQQAAVSSQLAHEAALDFAHAAHPIPRQGLVRSLTATPMCGPIRGGEVVQGLAWHPTGRLIAVANSHAYLYDLDGKQQFVVKSEMSQMMTAVAFSRDGRRLAAGSNGAVVWDIQTNKRLVRVRHKGLLALTRAVSLSPDGTRLATGCLTNAGGIWDVATGVLLFEVLHKDCVMAVAFSPDGSRIATGSDDKTARIWNATTGAQMLVVRHDRPVTAVAFSPDGTTLATASKDKTARLWNAHTGQQVLKLQHSGQVLDVSFSPDGRWLATASKDQTARISDITTGKVLLDLGHGCAVNAVAVSPDGNILATGGADHRTLLWKLGTSVDLTSPPVRENRAPKDVHPRPSA